MKNQPFTPVDITKLKNSIAKFEIIDLFQITRRGLFLIGIIKNGDFTVGDVIVFEFNDVSYQRKILESTVPRTTPQFPVKFALRIQTTNQSERDYFKTWQPNHYIADIYQLPKES